MITNQLLYQLSYIGVEMKRGLTANQKSYTNVAA